MHEKELNKKQSRVEYMKKYHSMRRRDKKTWNRRYKNGLTELTTVEVAEHIGVSPQAIQQLEISAMKKVKQAFSRRNLKDFIDFI